MIYIPLWDHHHLFHQKHDRNITKRIQKENDLSKCEASSRLDACTAGYSIAYYPEKVRSFQSLGCTAAGYSIAYYPEKVPADRDWPGIQEAVSCCGHSSFMRGLVTLVT